MDIMMWTRMSTSCCALLTVFKRLLFTSVMHCDGLTCRPSDEWERPCTYVEAGLKDDRAIGHLLHGDFGDFDNDLFFGLSQEEDDFDNLPIRDKCDPSLVALWKRCPLRGMRCADVAAGDLQTNCRESLRSSFSTFSC